MGAPFFYAITLSFGHHLMCIVSEAVECQIGDNLIIEQRLSLGNVSFAGEDGGLSFLTFTDDLLISLGLARR